MTLDEALALAKQGKAVRPEYFGHGWAVEYHSASGGYYVTVNPHTGSRHVFTPGDKDRQAIWREAEPVYEYAGFRYVVMGKGKAIQMIALEGQHPNAIKEKHRRAARECYMQENNIEP